MSRSLRDIMRGDAQRAFKVRDDEEDKLAVQNDSLQDNKNIAENTINQEAKDISPCKTKEEFFNYAFDEFVKIEGKGKPNRPGQIYSDSEGHPTIGVGHLVVHKRYVLGGVVYDKKTKKNKYVPPDPAKVASYRDKFIALPLLDKDGKPLSNQVKGQKYDTMIRMMKAKKRGLTDQELAKLDMGHLTEEGMHRVFAKDVEKATDRAIEDHPEEFWKMPKTAQASLVHMYFWGKGKTAEKLEATEKLSIGEQLPAAVRVGLAPNIAIRNLADRARQDTLDYLNFLKNQEIYESQERKATTLDFARMRGNEGR